VNYVLKGRKVMIELLEKPNKNRIDNLLIKISKVTNKTEKRKLISSCDICEYNNSGLYYRITYNEITVGFVKLVNYNKEKFIEGYELEEYIVDDLANENTIEISLLHIKEQYRCMGIGEYVVNWIKNSYCKQRLVLYTLIEAEEFWVKQNFRVYQFPLKENPEISYSEYVYYFN